MGSGSSLHLVIHGSYSTESIALLFCAAHGQTTPSLALGWFKTPMNGRCRVQASCSAYCLKWRQWSYWQWFQCWSCFSFRMERHCRLRLAELSYAARAAPTAENMHEVECVRRSLTRRADSRACIARLACQQASTVDSPCTRERLPQRPRHCTHRPWLALTVAECVERVQHGAQRPRA